MAKSKDLSILEQLLTIYFQMQIRRARNSDYDQVWTIFSKVIEGEDTFVYASNTPKSDLQKKWFASDMKTFVLELDSIILGTYFIRPNQIDLGNHIGNCGYMVHPDHYGKGIGDLLCKHSIEIGPSLGFSALQFNIVVSTNENAIKLWQKNGFKIIGIIPNGFKHKLHGLVDTLIMYRAL